MKFDPPRLARGPLSGKVYVITHGTIDVCTCTCGMEHITASVKYDITEQFDALVAVASHKGQPS